MALVMVTKDGTYNNGDDSAKKTFFESLGYMVTAIADDDTQAAYDNAAASNDVMWICATVDAPSTAGQRARGLDIGIVSEDNSTWDELMYYSGSSSSSDNSTSIYVNTNSHYITEPFSTGALPVFSSSTIRSGWNIALPAGATLLAEISSGGADTIFVVEDSGALYNSNYAANRRVFFGVTDNTGFSNRTANLETLLERSLGWALGNPDLYPDSTSNLNHGDVYVSAIGKGGKIDGGQDFDGVDDYISIPRHSTLEPSTAITFEAWLNWDNHSASAYGAVIHKPKDTDTDP
jgi:hypothetical protein